MVFLVECKPDQTLIEILTRTPKRNIIHSGNKSGVIIHLIKNYEDSKGVIDEDPNSRKPRSLQKFREIETFEDFDIKILGYADRNNYLVILNPRLEDWILRCAKESYVDIRAYGLPDDAIRLHEEINLQLNKFERLIRDLMKRSRRLKFLKKILMNSSLIVPQ